MQFLKRIYKQHAIFTYSRQFLAITFFLQVADQKEQSCTEQPPKVIPSSCSTSSKAKLQSTLWTPSHPCTSPASVEGLSASGCSWKPELRLVTEVTCLLCQIAAQCKQVSSWWNASKTDQMNYRSFWGNTEGGKLKSSYLTINLTPGAKVNAARLH